jgi:hypothetical protein
MRQKRIINRCMKARIREKIFQAKNGPKLPVGEFDVTVDEEYYTPAMLQEAEADMVQWLDSIGRALGYDMHPNTNDLLNSFADLGPTTFCADTEPK